MVYDGIASFGPEMMALIGFCTLCALFAMTVVAWRDYTRFEIEYAALAAATLATAPLILMAGGLSGLFAALVCAVLAGVVTALACYWRPGRIGQGDIWLLAALGFLAGPNHAPLVLALFVIFAVLTAALYSLARGKRLFASMFPAALPGMGAAIAALVLRLDDIWPAIPETLILALAVAAALIALAASLRSRRSGRTGRGGRGGRSRRSGRSRSSGRTGRTDRCRRSDSPPPMTHTN